MPGLKGTLKNGPDSHDGKESPQAAQALPLFSGALECPHCRREILLGTLDNITQDAPSVAGVSCLFSRKDYESF